MDAEYKTTGLMEKAVSLLAELPDDQKVVVTGAHTKWLKELEHRFKKSGLVDVVFMPYGSIISGKLRGVRGALMIDDFLDIPYRDASKLYSAVRHFEPYIYTF